MKLIGSKTEEDFRKELIKINAVHFSGNSKFRLKKFLESEGYSIKHACLLSWFQDETEDCYSVLINKKYIVTAEIERLDKTFVPKIKRIELKEYEKGLSRMNQIKLLVAKELIHEKT